MLKTKKSRTIVAASVGFIAVNSIFLLLGISPESIGIVWGLMITMVAIIWALMTWIANGQ